MVQDFFTTPQLRPFLTSKDKTTWVLPVGLAGELGTPRAYESYNRVADIVKHNVAADGPTDSARHRTRGHRRRPHRRGPNRTACPSRLRSPSWCSLVLLVVYRNPVTMLLPLVTIGTSLVIAQAVVAGVLRTLRTGCLKSVRHTS